MAAVTTDGGTTWTSPPAPPAPRTASRGRATPQQQSERLDGRQVESTGVVEPAVGLGRVATVAGRRRSATARRGGCFGGIRRAAHRAWRWVCATTRATLGGMLPRRALPSVRLVVRDELVMAERGESRVGVVEMDLVGGREHASATASARATRAPATIAQARTGLRQLGRFLEANPGLLAARVPVSGDAYDIAVEAWLLARCGGAASPWVADGAGVGNARIGGTVRSLLDRLGYSRGTTWTRSTAMAKALGAGDRDDTVHHPPVFLWEVVEALRMRPPGSLWESAAAALVVLGAVAARRKGGAALLLIEQVTQTGPDTVSVAPRHRPKPRRHRVQAARTAARAVVVSHWTIARYVLPWMEWHRKRGSPANGYLFPAIVENARARARTSVGFAVSSRWWVEPLRSWSQSAVTAAVHRYLLEPDGRTYQGLRVGNNIELTRNASRVTMATRRTLHERSLAPIIGSETAYIESFAEDFAEATRVLGRMRIVRRPDGLLSVVATSQSAGLDPADWVVVPTGTAQNFPVPKDATVVGADDTEDDDGSSSSGADVVGDGGRSTRNAICGRCARKLGPRDYGFLCDNPSCTWACCVDCHPGGVKVPLWCPPHLARRGVPQ